MHNDQWWSDRVWLINVQLAVIIGLLAFIATVLVFIAWKVMA